jgi:hypothetical protein
MSLFCQRMNLLLIVDYFKKQCVPEDRARHEKETMSMPVANVFCVKHGLTSTSRMDCAARMRFML